MTEENKISSEDMDSAQFFSLVISLSQSAMFAMGKNPNPVTGKVEKDMVQAQQAIDLLAMLKTKTSGNLTEKEKILLDNTLTSLRLTWAQEVEREKEEKKNKDEKKEPPGSDGESSG